LGGIETKSITVYLPSEGLQGENIPAHILWDNNLGIKTIRIFFTSPLKVKNVFNVKKWELNGNVLLIDEVEVDGYLGVLFETYVMDDTEVTSTVEFKLMSDDDFKEIKRTITMFRPQFEVKKVSREIVINPDTGHVYGRIEAKNAGRGLLILKISATDKSPTKVETPIKYREYIERFEKDFLEEFFRLSKEFPQYEFLFDETRKWFEKETNKKIMKLNENEKKRYKMFLERLSDTLAKDTDFLEKFLSAIMRAFVKNSEFINEIRRIVTLFESIVSNDIIVTNPFDEVILTHEKNEINLSVLQTDAVLNEYEEVTLPKIVLKISKKVEFPFKFPLYKLIKWS